jgi:hypothetical protein
MTQRQIDTWIRQHPPTLESRNGQLHVRVHGEGPNGDDIPAPVIEYLRECLGGPGTFGVPPRRATRTR